MAVYWNLDPSKENAANRAAKCVHIGLVNNMPNGALHPTERQFLNLLSGAAGGIDVRVSVYTLPELPRNEMSRRYINASYCSLERLWDSHLDGLIVTGTEPATANLADEPYWGSLTKIIDWADRNTHSTIWSCLAAHAAVLHLDGIKRRRLSEKRFGIFECARAADHHLTAGTIFPLQLPHSRWHDIAEDDLVSHGYETLTRTKEGVDSFVREGNSLFVFFQGHPEYEGNTLLLEYRRDVGRYLRGERDSYPLMPENYFDADTRDIFAALQQRAMHARQPGLLDEFPAVHGEKDLKRSWHSAALGIYSNWLEYLCACREQRPGKTRSGKRTVTRETTSEAEPSFAATD